MKSDIEIAQGIELKPISEIAESEKKAGHDSLSADEISASFRTIIFLYACIIVCAGRMYM